MCNLDIDGLSCSLLFKICECKSVRLILLHGCQYAMFSYKNDSFNLFFQTHPAERKKKKK